MASNPSKGRPPGPENFSSGPVGPVGPATGRPNAESTKPLATKPLTTQPPPGPTTPIQARNALARLATRPPHTRPATPDVPTPTFTADPFSESEEEDAVDLPTTPANAEENPDTDMENTPTRPTRPIQPMSTRLIRLTGTAKRLRTDSSPLDLISPPPQLQYKPQKSTSSASKVDAASYLTEALRLIKLAHAIDPKYSHFVTGLENAIQGKPDTLEQKIDQLLEITKANKSTTPLYSTAAKKGNAASSGQFQSQSQSQSQPQKSALKSQERTLVLQVADHQRETLKVNSFDLRNQINKAIGTRAVATVTKSIKGNIVLTTTQDHSADYLLEKTNSWTHIFKEVDVKSTEKPSSWIRVIAHGIPTQLLDTPTDLGVIKDEIHTFNPVKVVGTLGWLTGPERREGKRASSVVFAVATEADRKHCVKNGLFIAGERVTVVNYKAFSPKTQCYRCQGYSHDPTACRKPIKCRLCAGNHHTRDHKCNLCNSTTLCNHTTAKCANCSGSHAANSEECEVFRSIRL
jgi:hypothetical protein